MGLYDRTMKLLVDTNPEAMARFVLHKWQKQEQTTLPEVKITAVSQLSGEFQSEELDGDNVLLVGGPEGPLYLVEFQSTLHPSSTATSLCITPPNYAIIELTSKPVAQQTKGQPSHANH